MASMTVLWALAGAMGAYMTPEQAGFHDCMLIYEADNRDADSLVPYVAHVDAGGRPDAWLFDSFLYMRFGSAPSGAQYYNGPTTKEDWLRALDVWFEKGRDIDALQAAVDHVKGVLGPAPAPLKVILSLHYPHPGQRSFGDVDGDGTSEDLATPEARGKVVGWYVDEAIRRFEAAGHPDLELWGFYWMNEQIDPGDDDPVRFAADAIHERGLRLLWIPYYRATGYNRWRELGFDVAILQPNYAFLEQHHGRIRNDRLIGTAALAERFGLGVEMEAGSVVSDPRAREMFIDYLAFGAQRLCGYQGATRAYYQGDRLFLGLCRSKDPTARRAYDAISDFIAGREVPRPGSLEGSRAFVETPAGRVEAAGLTDGLFVTAERPEVPVASIDPATDSVDVELRGERAPTEVEISLVTNPESHWTGLVTIQGRRPNAEGWTPAGWKLASVAGSANAAVPKAVVAVPIGPGPWDELRLRFGGRGSGGSLRVDELSLVTALSPGETPVDSACVGCAYTTDQNVEAQYPDRGGRLTDGEVATEGFWQGKSVGWTAAEVGITIDLGTPRAVEAVRVHLEGGGYAAVNLPDTVTAELSKRQPLGPQATSGRGAAPEVPVPVAFATSGDVVVSSEREMGGSAHAVGTMDLVCQGPGLEGRYVTLRFACRGWLMVSEIEVLSAGGNAALGASYAVRPLPDPLVGTQYADDGARLTDGRAAEGFDRSAVVGWTNRDAVVTVDLGVAMSVREVSAFVLGGGLYGIVAPPSARVECSADGEQWAPFGSAALTDPADNSIHAMRLLVTGSATGVRYVRFTAARPAGWTMISEVAVR